MREEYTPVDMDPVSSRKATLAQRACSVTAVLLFVMAFRGAASPFLYHPILMSLGFLLLMCEAIAQAARATFLQADARLRLLQRHMYLQVAGAACIFAGLYAIYSNKEMHGKPHVTTTHSQLGVVVVLLVVTSLFLGAVSFKYLGLATRFAPGVQQALKVVHRVCGSLTFSLAMLTMVIGVRSASLSTNPYIPWLQLAVLAVPLSLAAVVYVNKEQKALLP
eukprot:Sspe_Gene.65396::Locus_38716_Transcript_1_3_Confidence_0.500_Length_1126::g.65396::m.65396/K08371/CYB561D2; cytochrome b-561 domain containing protein 2